MLKLIIKPFSTLCLLRYFNCSSFPHTLHANSMWDINMSLRMLWIIPKGFYNDVLIMLLLPYIRYSLFGSSFCGPQEFISPNPTSVLLPGSPYKTSRTQKETSTIGYLKKVAFRDFLRYICLLNFKKKHVIIK